MDAICRPWIPSVSQLHFSTLSPPLLLSPSYFHPLSYFLISILAITITTTILIAIPITIQFLVNELVKCKVAAFRNKSTDNLAMPERLFAGACAGLCYWVGTFPLDAIKVREHCTVLYCAYFEHCTMNEPCMVTGRLNCTYSHKTSHINRCSILLRAALG